MMSGFKSFNNFENHPTIAPTIRVSVDTPQIPSVKELDDPKKKPIMPEIKTANIRRETEAQTGSGIISSLYFLGTLVVESPLEFDQDYAPDVPDLIDSQQN